MGLGECGGRCGADPLPRAPGGLSLAVEGPSKAEITCKDNKDGTCTVSYLPTAPGDYNIIVRFDDKHIPGSPFTAKITGERGLKEAFGDPLWPWGPLPGHGHGDTCVASGNHRMAMGSLVQPWPPGPHCMATGTMSMWSWGPLNGRGHGDP